MATRVTIWFDADVDAGRPGNGYPRVGQVFGTAYTHPNFPTASFVVNDVGMVVLEDAETGEQVFVDTHDKKFRQRFAEAAQKREAELSAAFKRTGVDVLHISTEDDLVRQIVRFAKRREQVRR